MGRHRSASRSAAVIAERRARARRSAIIGAMLGALALAVSVAVVLSAAGPSGSSGEDVQVSESVDLVAQPPVAVIEPAPVPEVAAEEPEPVALIEEEQAEEQSSSAATLSATPAVEAEPTVDEPAPVSLAEARAIWRAAVECRELEDAIASLPDRYNLRSQHGRTTARGAILIHLMTIEDLEIPGIVKDRWPKRVASCRKVADALAKPAGSEAEADLYGEAEKLLQASRGIYRDLRDALPEGFPEPRLDPR